MFERNYFGMMMVETGEADAFITGVYTKYSNTIKVAKEVIGIQPEYNHFGTMHIMNSKKGTYFLADTLINRRHGEYAPALLPRYQHARRYPAIHVADR